MLETDMGIFLRIPEESDDRTLHPAIVVEATSQTYTVSVAETDLALEGGQELLVYYDKDREFVQQPARIAAVLQGGQAQDDDDEESESDDDDPGQIVIGLELFGKPVSAENRQCYRVSTVVANLFSRFGKEERCPLLDVSASGFSVESSQLFKIGDVVEGTLLYEDKEFHGLATVQSCRELGGGRFRYGLHSVEDKSKPADLLKGQQFISMSLQREQARRLSGTG